MKSDFPLLYSVSALPPQLSWGAPPAEPGDDDLSPYITLDSRPLRVLIIGEVMQAYLVGSVKNRGSASIRVKPLLTSDGERLDVIFEQFSSSTAGKSSPHCTLVMPLIPCQHSLVALTSKALTSMLALVPWSVLNNIN